MSRATTIVQSICGEFSNRTNQLLMAGLPRWEGGGRSGPGLKGNDSVYLFCMSNTLNNVCYEAGAGGLGRQHWHFQVSAPAATAGGAEVLPVRRVYPHHRLQGCAQGGGRARWGGAAGGSSSRARRPLPAAPQQ